MTQPPGYPIQPSDPYGQPQSPYGPSPYPYGQQQPWPAQQPGPYPADPFAQYAYGQPDPLFAPSAPKKGRGTVIALIVLACLLVLLGGGTAAYLAFGRSEGTGAATPAKAVDQFLTAVFKDKSAESADAITCASAKDSSAMRKRLTQLREFELKYKSPSYTWPTPTVESESAKTATVTTAVKLTTSDDRVSEQRLKFVTVNGDGWLVCEINQA